MCKSIMLTAPGAWACYLLNFEQGDLTESELYQIHAWLDREGMYSYDTGYQHPVSCQPCGFLRNHDALIEAPYGADCEEYTFLLAK